MLSFYLLANINFDPLAHVNPLSIARMGSERMVRDWFDTLSSTQTQSLSGTQKESEEAAENSAHLRPGSWIFRTFF